MPSSSPSCRPKPDSGTGKSELALQLVRRGHALVADDAPELTVDQGRVIGRSSYALAGKLQLRGLGVLDLGERLGSDALKSSAPIELIIALSRQAETDPRPLEGSRPGQQILLGVRLPCWTIPVDRAPASPELIELAAQLTIRQPGSHTVWN